MSSGKNLHRPIRRALPPLGHPPRIRGLGALVAAVMLVFAIPPGAARAQESEPASAAVLCNGLPPTLTVTPGLPLVGTEGRDIILGTPGNDDIAGLGGGDIICGLAGRDIISGGEGNDLILGGRGNDRLFGNEGQDRLRGGPGNDRIFSGVGNDIAVGGFGNDRLFGGRGNDRLLGGLGDDDRCSGGTGFDRFRECESEDALDFLRQNGFGPLSFGIDNLASARLKLATTFGPATSETEFAECGSGPSTILAWGDSISLLFQDDVLQGWLYGSFAEEPLLTMANGVTPGVTAAQVRRLAPGTTTFRVDTLGPEFFNEGPNGNFGGFIFEGEVADLFAGVTCFFR